LRVVGLSCDEVFACTDTKANAEQIINRFVMRWGPEVTLFPAHLLRLNLDKVEREILFRF
jgi:hypothetical protein